MKREEGVGEKDNKKKDKDKHSQEYLRFTTSESMSEVVDCDWRMNLTGIIDEAV